MSKFVAMLIAICISGFSGWLLAVDYPPPEVSIVSAEMYVVLLIVSIILSLLVSVT